ncbi:hypothetical protein EMIT0373P_20712 [Pseudomonas chlororaphis]
MRQEDVARCCRRLFCCTPVKGATLTGFVPCPALLLVWLHASDRFWLTSFFGGAVLGSFSVAESFAWRLLEFGYK